MGVTSRHLVDAELRAALDFLPSFTFGPDNLAEIRKQFAEMEEAALAGAPADVPADVDIEQRRILSPEGHEVPILIHRPRGLATPAPAVLHIHGGGYVMGSATMMLASNQALARDAECLVVAVDYRLSPETSHPGPVEDCYVALKWLHDNAATLGVDTTRIAVAGESAGGGLAAALALLARDRGEVALVHQHLIYPMLDDRTDCASCSPYAGEFVWTPESNQFGWSSLLGVPAGGEGLSAYAAPARADDLAGLPGAFISVGALDLFMEEDLEYARRLARAGVPIELHVYPGAYHGFDLAAEAAVTVNAHRNALLALRRALHGGQG